MVRGGGGSGHLAQGFGVGSRGGAEHLLQQRLHVNGHAKRRQPFRNFSYARDSRRSLRRQELRQRRVSSIKEIAQHVDVARLFDRRDLDTGYQQHAGVRCLCKRFVDAVGGVVIGHREDAHSGADSTLDERCPNCGGELLDRPTRVGKALANNPASTERKFKG